MILEYSSMYKKCKTATLAMCMLHSIQYTGILVIFMLIDILFMENNLYLKKSIVILNIYMEILKYAVYP